MVLLVKRSFFTKKEYVCQSASECVVWANRRKGERECVRVRVRSAKSRLPYPLTILPLLLLPTPSECHGNIDHSQKQLTHPVYILLFSFALRLFGCIVSSFLVHEKKGSFEQQFIRNGSESTTSAVSDTSTRLLLGVDSSSRRGGENESNKISN